MAELTDLVDKDGVLVKAGVPRDDLANYPGLHMRIVIVVLFRGEHVLVHARSLSKKVGPGHIDHVCGGLISGETPLQAAMREAYEETGITPSNMRLVAEGVNEYGRYRYLFVGDAQDQPAVQDNEEVEWADYIHLDDLYAKYKSGELAFVDGFFKDIELAKA